MKKLIFLFLYLCINTITFAGNKEFDFKEGDIIFHISQSKQSPVIQYATLSLWSHCGIIVNNHGKWYVLEASNVVKLTPVNEFINRGKFRMFKIKRSNLKNIKIKFKHLLNIPYDINFSPDKNKFYCSELVHYIYKTQLNINLCKYNQVKDYNLLGLKNIMNKRNINQNQLVVAPSDILESKFLTEAKI
jgi:hypothetical protein